jgi:quercetin dioxygenase-like cupin family protein
MKEKFNEATPQRPEGDRALDATLVHIDLPFYMRQIKDEAAWKDGKKNAITVFKTEGLRIVLIALHEGAELARHLADGIISIQVLDGKLQFNTDLQAIELENGQMLALHERIPHSVLAIKETIFLLTLTSTGKKSE